MVASRTDSRDRARGDVEESGEEATGLPQKAGLGVWVGGRASLRRGLGSKDAELNLGCMGDGGVQEAAGYTRLV